MKKTALFLAIISILIPNIFSANTDVRLNSLGFLPNKDKKASIDLTCTAFNLIRVSDAATVFTGNVGAPITANDSGETIRVADFSAYTTPGTYYLNVPGVGNSVNFNIAADTYNNAYYMSMKAFYLWRCGTAVSYTYPRDGNTYSHASCHMQDAYDNYVGGTGTKIPSTKGWHDAGDYNKYVVNAGITLGMLFMAWEQFGTQIQTITLDVPNTAAGYPDYLKELKWETDWILTMQRTDGAVYDKVSETGFDAFELPDLDTGTRYFWGYGNLGTVETATFCSMMAMAARNFQPYDAAYATTCLNAATSAYNYLISHLTNTTANLTGCTTGSYAGSDADAGRMWAAVEMWETTGNTTYLTDAETRINSYSPNFVSADFDWANDRNLAMYTYAMSARTGRNATYLANVRNNIVATANTIVTTRNNHAYGRPLGTNYYWGCNGAVARQSMILQIANQISPNAAYLNTALDAVGYLFGRNMHDRAYVTGVGINPPMNPHHRPSGGDSITNPWPGYLVGGSNGTNGGDPILTAMAGGLPGAQYWQDNQGSYASNEVAINWQGALVYALAGFIGSVAPPTVTATETSTQTFTPTQSRTATPTFTCTPSRTFTATYTVTVTATPTSTKSVTSTFTAVIFSPTNTITLTSTPSFTITPSSSPTGTYTQISVYSPTFSATVTKTTTGTPVTATYTYSVTLTYTLSRTTTYTQTLTITATVTPTITFTSAVPSRTSTPTISPTVAAPTNTLTMTVTNTAQVPISTMTFTPTQTVTPFINPPTPDTDPGVWPCPVNPAYQDLNVIFYISGASTKVSFNIYTRGYRLVKKLELGAYPQGTNECKINREYIYGLSNGIYYYVIESSINGKKSISKIRLFVILK
jgi:endoglucanase